MPNRIPKINQLLKKELGNLILREVDFPDEALVTVTRVEVLPNLIEARVYISTLPENQAKNVLEILNRRIYDLQQKINKKLRMRPVPQIKFFEEKTTSRAARVEELLEELKKEEN